ncbi:MAG: carboxylating nicotinate-nucleotide diphosphorylase [Chloroflexi bacterium]|nr:carboxylating nicotinate-nucleotide diphosphorylase [Chloroflexota bacterium]
MIIPSREYIDSIVEKALEEDVGPGDITTSILVPPGVKSRASLIFKEDGVLAGLDFADAVFKKLDPAVKFFPAASDGEFIKAGRTAASWEGNAAALLTGERTALNFVQHLSGIATYTRRLTDLLKGSRTRLLDTRKTIPGLRLAEKYAVASGGGKNHRMGLYDQVLIKNNHLEFYPDISEAVKKARSGAPESIKVEVEVRKLDEIEPVINAGTDIILLDNMDDRTVGEAMKIIAGRVPAEVSGGITEDRLVVLKNIGVDYISMGKLTHSVKALDVHLLLEQAG